MPFSQWPSFEVALNEARRIFRFSIRYSFASWRNPRSDESMTL